MNIEEAKEEIKRTVKAYHQKDASGCYKIPVERQRPLFLMGPPGIGKTAIVEQVAEELGINLISYTITHHTRQSAIGLPYISKKMYGDRDVSITEYTMSEIVASVYEQIEKTGISEGILFLDEINAVSETLAPTMLQFLQYKTFGMHQVPEGFVLVTAGNPTEYNKSVRDFDIVTLDRLRKIEIQEDFSSFKNYAYNAGLHSAILSYLEIKKENFYFVKQDLDGKRFVTARAWEDLSKIMQVYEELHYPLEEKLMAEYLADEEVAKDFALYYDLYCKYREIYHVPDILAGKEIKDVSLFVQAPFDEKISLLSLLVEALQNGFYRYKQEQKEQEHIFGLLKKAKEKMQELPLEQVLGQEERTLEQQRKRAKEAKMLSKDQEKRYAHLLTTLSESLKLLQEQSQASEEEKFGLLKFAFQEKEEARKKDVEETGKMLSNALHFLGEVFGEGQELLLFLSELSKSKYALAFLSEVGNETYSQYNHYLLLQDQKKSLQEELRAQMEL